MVYLVKVWRELHERKKWSLIQAAKLIGISKKSLDDYYLVLRVGEIQGYDFASGGRVTTLTLTDGGLVPRL